MLLADIAVLRLDQVAKIRVGFDLARLDGGGWQGVGRCEHGTTAQFPDAGLIKDLLFPLHFLRLVLPYPGLDELALLSGVWQEDLPGSLEQPGVFLGRKVNEEQAVGGRLFQNLDGGAQLFR